MDALIQKYVLKVCEQGTTWCGKYSNCYCKCKRYFEAVHGHILKSSEVYGEVTDILPDYSHPHYDYLVETGSYVQWLEEFTN